MDISSSSFTLDVSKELIKQKENKPFLVNRGPIKKEISFTIVIKKDGYILDAFKGHQNLSLVEREYIKVNSMEDFNKPIYLDDLKLFDFENTKIHQSA